jgi:hypothetical protein
MHQIRGTPFKPDLRKAIAKLGAMLPDRVSARLDTVARDLSVLAASQFGTAAGSTAEMGFAKARFPHRRETSMCAAPSQDLKLRPTPLDRFERVGLRRGGGSGHRARTRGSRDQVRDQAGVRQRPCASLAWICRAGPNRSSASPPPRPRKNTGAFRGGRPAIGARRRNRPFASRGFRGSSPQPAGVGRCRAPQRTDAR